MCKIYSKRRKAIRKEFWDRDSTCYYCGRETELPIEGIGGNIPDNTATIDHIFSRKHPYYDLAINNKYLVLSCKKCNTLKALAEDRVTTWMYKDIGTLKRLGFKVGAEIVKKLRKVEEEYVAEVVAKHGKHPINDKVERSKGKRKKKRKLVRVSHPIEKRYPAKSVVNKNGIRRLDK